MEAVSS